MENKKTKVHLRKAVSDYLDGKKTTDGEQAFDGWYQSFDSVNDDASTDQKKLRKEARRILRNSLPRQRKRSYSQIFKIAAAFVLIALCLYFVNAASDQHREVSELSHAEAPRGKRVTVKLPDGTTVVLNAGSRLHYPKDFTGKNREVILEGEAFFDVARDESRPFLVEAGNAVTRVIGTSFIIRSWNERPSSDIIVYSGLVKVTSKTTGSTIMLEKHQHVRVANKNGALSLLPVRDPQRFSSWMEGKLTFDDETLAEVIPVIERAIDANIKIESARLSDCRISGSLYAGNAEEVLKALSLMFSLEWRKENGQYILSGEGCRAI